MTTKTANANYKRLYLAKARKDFSRQFWRKDLPILLATAYILTLVIFCASVKFVEWILR